MDVFVYYGFASSSEQRAAVGYGMFFTCIEQMKKFENIGGLQSPMIPKPDKDSLGQLFYPVKDTEIKLRGEIHTREREIFLRTVLDILTKCMDAQTMTIYLDKKTQPRLGKVIHLLTHPKEFVKTHENDYTNEKNLTQAEITLLKSIYYKLNIPTGREIKDRQDRRTVMFMLVEKDLYVKAAIEKARFALGESPDSKPVKYSVYVHSQAIDEYQDLVTRGEREFSLGYAALAVKREENGVPLVMSTLSNADVVMKGVATSKVSPDELYLQALLNATQGVVSQLINGQRLHVTLVTKDQDFVALFSYPGIISEYSMEIQACYHTIKTLFLSLSEVHIVCVNENDVYGQRCLMLCDELADTASYKHKEAIYESANKAREADKKRKKKKKKKR